MSQERRRFCEFEGCEKPHLAKGFCSGHYSQSRSSKEMRPIHKNDVYDPICSFEGCSNPNKTKGFCGGHYQQHRKGKELRPLGRVERVCSFEGCGKKHRGKGYCTGHYEQFIKGGELFPIGEVPRLRKYNSCSFEGCERAHTANGLCRAHYYQQRNRGELHPVGEFVRTSKYDSVCSFKGCESPHRARGLCGGHFTQLLKGIELKPIYSPKLDCSVEGCEEPHTAKGYCKIHWRELHTIDGLTYRQRQREKMLMHVYQITVDEWDALFESQGHQCAICGTKVPGGHKQKQWHTDHDHGCCSGKKTCGQCIRGILCPKCNTTLGFVEKHPNITRLLAYIGIHIRLAS